MSCSITPGETGAGAAPLPIEVELETTLDFDRILLDGSGGGAVRLLPDGTSELSGAVESVGGRVRIGRIIIRGAPGRPVHVDFPKSLDLIGAKGTAITVTSLVTNLPVDPILDANGQLAIDFGGELAIDGESDGDFRGNLQIRADYL